MLPAFPSNKLSSQGMTVSKHDLLLLAPCKGREKTQQSAQCSSATAHSENLSLISLHFRAYLSRTLKICQKPVWWCLSGILHIHQNVPLTILDL